MEYVVCLQGKQGDVVVEAEVQVNAADSHDAMRMAMQLAESDQLRWHIVTSRRPSSWWVAGVVKSESWLTPEEQHDKAAES